VPRSVRRDHTEAVVAGEDRRDLVRMESAASLPIPEEEGGAAAIAPLVDEQAEA
jgi:hypothetical protein